MERAGFEDRLPNAASSPGEPSVVDRAPFAHFLGQLAPRSPGLSDLGDAYLMGALAASEAIDEAKAALELAELLPQARRQALKLGAVEPSNPGPLLEKLPSRCRNLASSSIERFQASQEFDSRTAYAVFVPGSDGGFSDRKGRLKMDVAEALLFPSEKKALTHAKRYVGASLAVEVRVSVVGFKPLMGALSSAELSELMAELERRRALDAGAERLSTDQAPKSARL